MTQSFGTWSQETVGGHACDIFEPREQNRYGYVVLYLHGVHVTKLHDKTPFLQAFCKYGLPVVAPITGQSWWTDRICPEFDGEMTAERHVLDHVLPYIQVRWSTEPGRIGLLGTSMGGQGALRLAYKYPDTFPVVSAISPAIDFHTRLSDGDQVLQQMYPHAEACRQDTAILYVHPLNWPRHQFFCCDPTDHAWFNSSDRLRMKLAALGVMHECDLETVGGGHGFGYYNMMADKAIGFVSERLERERMRIV